MQLKQLGYGLLVFLSGAVKEAEFVWICVRRAHQHVLRQ